jgi:hypothetical protein
MQASNGLHKVIFPSSRRWSSKGKEITGYTPKASHSGRTELAGRAFVAFNLHRTGCFDTF